ncbi:N/A [soil metagenome]
MRLLIPAILLTLSLGCGKRGLPAPTGGGATTPAKVNLKRAVELTPVRQKTIVSAVEQVGTLEARQTTDIAAGVTGVVDVVLFDEGQLVDPLAKTPLVRIDQEKYEQALAASQAAEKRAVANFARAKDIFQRAETSGAGASDSERRQANETMNAAEADLLVSRANLKLAEHNFDRSKVLPPYRGQINQRRVTPGMYVKEDTIIASIADLSEIRLVGYVPESAAPMIRARMEQRPVVNAARTIAAVFAGSDGNWGGITTRMLAQQRDIPSGFDPEFTVPSLPRRTFRGVIFYMSTVADPTTHMFECKARIETGDAAFNMLKPGYTARIRFPYESTADAVVVPEESVRATERGFIVFEVIKQVGKDGTESWIAKSRKVEIGARSPGWVEVRSGIRPGQWIVQRGAEALDDGVPVKIPDEQLKLLK